MEVAPDAGTNSRLEPAETGCSQTPGTCAVETLQACHRGVASATDCLQHTRQAAAGLAAAVSEVERLVSLRLPTSRQPCSSGIDHRGEADTAALQQQLLQLETEKRRVEADRDELSRQQGQHKATIAKLEGSVASSERRLKQQAADLEALKAAHSSVQAQLAEARGRLGLTPERCRVTQRHLQEEASKALGSVRSSAAQVRKLKEIVRHEALEIHELREFAEAERLTLLEEEVALEAELRAEQERREDAAAQLDVALGDISVLDQQLGMSRAEAAAARERTAELEALSAQQGELLASLSARCSQLEVERDAAARNLRRAEQELQDVGDFSTKLFRQVRFFSHTLDKNAAHLAKVPEFASLSRELRSFVAENARNWDGLSATCRDHTRRDDGRGQAASSYATGTSLASGVARDVARDR